MKRFLLLIFLLLIPVKCETDIPLPLRPAPEQRPGPTDNGVRSDGRDALWSTLS